MNKSEEKITAIATARTGNIPDREEECFLLAKATSTKLLCLYLLMTESFSRRINQFMRL